MSDLVERYVHQVGRYLPRKERAEIEAELRSQIADKLDDRYETDPTPEEVAAVLADFGPPHQIAASYNSQYLIGPDLYPFMTMVLRYGWVLVPAIVAFLNIFGTLTAQQPVHIGEWLLDTAITVAEATLMFTAVVILVFAFIQRVSAELKKAQEPFNPLNLPEVDDPRAVDRVEEAFGLAFGTVIALVFLYFLRVGGLTLRFDLLDPGEVIPVPLLWLVLLLASVLAQLVTNALVLLRNRWSVGLMLAQMVLEVFGLICLYFVVLVPVFTRINPDLINAVEIIVIVLAILALLSRGSKIAALLNYGKPSRGRLKSHPHP